MTCLSVTFLSMVWISAVVTKQTRRQVTDLILRLLSVLLFLRKVTKFMCMSHVLSSGFKLWAV